MDKQNLEDLIRLPDELNTILERVLDEMDPNRPLAREILRKSMEDDKRGDTLTKFGELLALIMLDEIVFEDKEDEPETTAPDETP